MPKLLEPWWTVNRVEDINLAFLQRMGYTGLIVDLDNTLVCWDQPTPKVTTLRWLQDLLEQGIGICIISNNFEHRAEAILQQLPVYFIPKAGKPKRGPFIKALQLLQLPAAQVLVVGDQLFTDVFGGNRSGLATVLVKPLGNREFAFTKVTRQLEKVVFGLTAFDFDSKRIL